MLHVALIGFFALGGAGISFRGASSTHIEAKTIFDEVECGDFFSRGIECSYRGKTDFWRGECGDFFSRGIECSYRGKNEIFDAPHTKISRIKLLRKLK